MAEVVYCRVCGELPSLAWRRTVEWANSHYCPACLNGVIPEHQYRVWWVCEPCQYQFAVSLSYRDAEERLEQMVESHERCTHGIAVAS